MYLDHLSSPDGGPEESHPRRSGGDAAIPEERHLLLPHGQGKLAGPPAGHREHPGVHRCREAEDQRRPYAKVRCPFIVTHCVYLLLPLRLHAKVGKSMSKILVRAKVQCLDYLRVTWRS